MEVDTGAAASVMSYADYERNFKYLALRPVNRSFHANTGTPLDVAGQVLVDVAYNGQQMTLPLLIVRAKRHAPSTVWQGVDDEDPLRLAQLVFVLAWPTSGGAGK